jgi:hypothetical protein
MRLALSKLALALALPLALGACQKPDVGARCELGWNRDPSNPTQPPTPQTAAADYFETGNSSCDDQICIVSPAPAGSRYGGCSGDSCGYCSKPCVSDKDCYKSDTGLVCDWILPDSTLVSGGGDTLQMYLPDTNPSRYCVVPRPQQP